LVTEFFDTRNDPDQISVTPQDRAKLESIHPATLSEYTDGDGPVVWIMLIPTTKAIMDRFITGTITEQQLLNETKPGTVYDTIYLCSASVLPEYRRKGLAKKVTIDAINSIREDHPIIALFYWPFSDDGRKLARSIARETGLPLFEKHEATTHGHNANR